MKRALILEKLGRCVKADYSLNPDYQRQIMEDANKEAFIEWCRKEEAPVLQADTLEYQHKPFISLSALMP